ncbi:MAG: hypothetical protein ACR5LG_12215 [Sodalis sp. (in: enterobacteria)]
MLTDMKTALADSLRHGKTLTQFQDKVLPLLQRKGGLGKGLKASVDGELEGKKLSPYRLETIFRANTQSAYMGRAPSAAARKRRPACRSPHRTGVHRRLSRHG